MGVKSREKYDTLMLESFNIYFSKVNFKQISDF